MKWLSTPNSVPLNIFLTEEIKRIPSTVTGGASYTVMEDTQGYHGVSLFETYTQLWKVLEEYDLQVTPHVLPVEQLFSKLTYFPFKSVADIMTDHVRYLLRRHLRITWLPYTLQQAESLARIGAQYPTTVKEKEQVKSILDDIQQLTKLVDNNLKHVDIMKDMESFTQALERYLVKLYEIPNHLFWLIVKKAKYLTFTLSNKLPDHIGLKTALGYIQNYQSTHPVQLKDLEEQLVDDITDLMVFSYPHPEMIIALEKAQAILSLYYTPVEASKLFVDDVVMKMQQYIDNAKRKLGIELTDYFRQPRKEKVKPKPTSVDEQYHTYLQLLKTYQATGTRLRELLELHQTLLSLPYQQVQHLTGFRENIWYVEHLNKPNK